MNFGEQEGLHYDGLSEQEKETLSSPNYQAPGGENWLIVKERVQDYFSSLSVGNHLVFTHGGTLTTILYDHGIEEMPNNGSVFGVTFND